MDESNIITGQGVFHDIESLITTKQRTTWEKFKINLENDPEWRTKFLTFAKEKVQVKADETRRWSKTPDSMLESMSDREIVKQRGSLLTKKTLYEYWLTVVKVDHFFNFVEMGNYFFQSMPNGCIQPSKLLNSMTFGFEKFMNGK